VLTYKTSGSQRAVDVKEADGVLERTLLKRGVSRNRHGGQLVEVENDDRKETYSIEVDRGGIRKSNWRRRGGIYANLGGKKTTG
jgi:hypothetical protein